MSVRTRDVLALSTALSGPRKPTVVDVRTRLEFGGGHVPGSLNMPLGELRPEELEDQGEIWLICRSGARSMMAASELSSVGLPVVNVDGGLVAWRARGFETAGNPARRWALPALAGLALLLAGWLWLA